MKILLDECVTKKLKAHIYGHVVHTVSSMKWNGLKNGRLLDKASKEQFDILLTIDKNISYQQNISNYKVAVCVINSFSSKLEDILKLLPSFIENIMNYEKGKYYLIEK